MNDDLLRAIIKSACDTFQHLKITEVGSPGDGLGLLAFEITNDYNTVYFPAVGGYVTGKELPKDNTSEESATSEYFSELREENAVIDPVKVIISSRAWSAILIALNTNVKKCNKIAKFENDLWVIDKAFIEMLNKVSTHGLLSVGSARLCCGITPDEYGNLTEELIENRAVKRNYPGGGFAYQDPNCDVFVEMNKKTFLPAYPFHRCGYCRRWLHRRVKKKLNESKEENSEQTSTGKIAKLTKSKGKGKKRKKKYEETSDESNYDSDISQDYQSYKKSIIEQELEDIMNDSD